jgi:dihydroorotate dehydrogenase electron transfer subunit
VNQGACTTASDGPLALTASCYADGALHATATILANRPVARDTRLLRIDCPAIAGRITPGQFVMLRVAGLSDPLLGRAFALYDVDRDSDGAPRALDVVYLVKGKLTTELARRTEGDLVDVWGPLGNGFTAELVEASRPPSNARAIDRLILVAGGIGQTPMLALGKEALGVASYGDPAVRQPLRAGRVSLLYGVRTADLAAGVDDFRAAGLDLHLTSDDGTTGRRGLVTELLTEQLDTASIEGAAAEGASVVVACCGPEAMMAATAAICSRRNVPCLVSLETPMACGVGACFSCVAPVKTDDGWDYKRTCVEGPVFEASRIDWSAL